MAWKAHVAKIAAEALRAMRGNVRRGIARLAQVLDTLDRFAPRDTTYASMRDLAMWAANGQGAAALG